MQGEVFKRDSFSQYCLNIVQTGQKQSLGARGRRASALEYSP
jgi:hypothetical protein